MYTVKVKVEEAPKWRHIVTCPVCQHDNFIHDKIIISAPPQVGETTCLSCGVPLCHEEILNFAMRKSLCDAS